MKIRRYEEDDYYQLTNLYKVPELFGGNFDENRDTPEKLLHTSSQDKLLVAVDDIGLLIGSVMLLSNPHSFWVIRFVLDDKHPEYEEAGERLMKFAEKIATNEGHNDVIVYSSRKYEKLATRYSKLGFDKADEYVCYWKELKDEI